MMHLMPWQSWRNQIRKTNQEMKNPTQGEETNEPPQWEVTNSHPERDKNPDHDFRGAIRSLGSPALSSQVCLFIPINSLCFPTSVSPWNSSLHRQEPRHCCSALSTCGHFWEPPLVSLLASTSWYSVSDPSKEKDSDQQQRCCRRPSYAVAET